MIQKDRKSAHVLTEKDLRAILSAVDPQSPDNPWRESSIRERNLVILMLLFFGLRSSEVLQMRIYDIDCSSGLLRIGHHTKTKTVLLPQHLLDLLRRYLLYPCNLGKKVRAQDHEYVFRSYRSGKRLMPQDLSRILTVLQQKVPGLSTKVTARSFRHAYIKSHFSDNYRKNVPRRGFLPKC